MRKILILTILIVLTLKAQGEDRVSIAYFEAQPHILYNYSTKKVYGALYIFLEKYIAPKMGVKLVWDSSPSNVPRQLHMLSNESVDALAFLLYTENRAKIFSYTKESFYISKPVIGVLKSNSLWQINKVEDILPLKIGYVAKTFLSPFMRDERIKFDLLSSSDANRGNLLKLNAGRIDAIYIPDKAALLYEMKALNLESKIRVLNIPEKPGTSHVVFSKSNKALAKRFDKAYKEINGYKVYQEILSKYLDINALN